MDTKKFYDLIRSDDIKRHCKKIGYVPDTLQCIELVFNSVSIPINERHRLYEEIMAAMPEPELPPEAENRDKTFYELLKEHIENEVNAGEEFLKDKDKSVYQLSSNDDYATKLYDIIASERKCGTSRRAFTVYNRLVDDFAWFSAKGIPSSFSVLDDFTFTFYEYDIAPLPIPFKSGDILYYSLYDNSRIPCVFDALVKKNGRACAIIYLRDNKTGFIKHNTVKYDGLNYFRYSLHDKFMKLLSDYLHKKIDIATLLNAYVVNLCKAGVNKFNDPRFIQEDHLPFIYD